nr:MAG TPA: hypothetical protein [Caudoviricetes sp.]DAO71913.1 MAG TPA: hypothetical protein [Caudoviricetes sp.]DAS48003.1 MAG TPA: hypothetical protein [Caudoviricetes sp.]
MKHTVLYTSNGDILAVVSEQSDLESLKIGTFEVPDGNVIDSIDVSKKDHTVVSHETPMGDFAKIKEELEATKQHLDELNRKRSEETEELRAAILATATMLASKDGSEEAEEDEGL